MFVKSNFNIADFYSQILYIDHWQLIFKTTDPAKGWDGTFKSVKQPTGSYTWFVEAVDINGRNYFEKGTVILIR